MESGSEPLGEHLIMVYRWLQLEDVGGQVSVGSEAFEGFGIWLAVAASGRRQILRCDQLLPTPSCRKCRKQIQYTSRFVRVILAQGPC